MFSAINGVLSMYLTLDVTTTTVYIRQNFGSKILSYPNIRNNLPNAFSNRSIDSIDGYYNFILFLTFNKI